MATKTLREINNEATDENKLVDLTSKAVSAYNEQASVIDRAQNYFSIALRCEWIDSAIAELQNYEISPEHQEGIAKYGRIKSRVAKAASVVDTFNSINGMKSSWERFIES